MTLDSEGGPFRENLRQLLCYLAASARGLMSEPAEYGPLRLMEAASRLIGAMTAAGMGDPGLEQALRQIERGKEELMSGLDSFAELADAVLEALLDLDAAGPGR
ncbi:MAG: DUF6092 family protein [bacterium]|nr:DUF6092 family protein [bacterium]